MHKLIVANYKMNGNKEFFVSLQKSLKKSKDTEIILCPPFVYLSYLRNKSGFYIGAQNVSCEINGKRTGDISADMLSDIGVKFCIVGHSERNQPYNTDEIIAKKVENCVCNGIVPIICIGEEREEQLKNITDVIKNAIKYIKNCNVIFAYEPVWSIGTGKIATNENINKVVEFVNKICNEKNITSKTIYGGSVNLTNYKKLKNSNIDGFMVGKLCLDMEKFNDLLKGIEYE